jgi:hypothetical protein
VPHGDDSSARALDFLGKLEHCVGDNFLSFLVEPGQVILLPGPLTAHKCLLISSHRLFMKCSDVLHCGFHRNAIALKRHIQNPHDQTVLTLPVSAL